MGSQDYNSKDASELDQLCLMIDQCSELLKQLKIAINNIVSKTKSSNNSQNAEYRSAVLDFLTTMISNLQDIKEKEIKREKQRFLASSGLANSAILLQKYEKPEFELRNRKNQAKFQIEIQESSSDDQRNREALDLENLTPEEAIQLEQENKNMWITLNDEENAFMNVASSIHSIERLNHVLSGHLTEQFAMIQSIGDHTNHANESIKLGNDSLRSTMSNRSVMRFWIVFIVCVLSIALIFLDWFND